MSLAFRNYNSLRCRLLRPIRGSFLFSSQVEAKALRLTIRSSSSSSTNRDFASENVQPFEKIPGSGILANFRNFILNDGMTKLHLLEQESRQKYGPIFRLMFGPWKAVYVCNPDAVQQVYRMEGQFPIRDPEIPMVSKYKRDRGRSIGIFFSDGEIWYKARSALSGKMLKPKEVAEYSPQLQRVASDLLSSLTELKTATSNQTVPHLQNQLFKWSLESVGTVLFEKRFGLFENPPSEEAQNFIKAAQTIFKGVNEIFYYPAWLADYYKTQGIRKFYDSMDVLYNFTDSAVQSKVKEIDKRGEDIKNDTYVDLLTSLVGSKNLPLDEITENLVDLLFAAVDTTSTTTAWTLYNLAKNPEVQEKLHEEITSVLEPGEIATPSKINQMHYLRACIRETLRVYPATVDNTRLFDKDVTIMGYNIPKGTMVLIPMYAMGRDPEIFDDPLTYKPERWMRSDQSQHCYHPFASLPFGHGVRMCIGRRIAMLEMSLLLSMVVQKYHLESMNDVVPTVRAVLIPDKDVLIKFTDR